MGQLKVTNPLPLQADQEAAQVADTCGSNGTSLCGSQAHDIREAVSWNRKDSVLADRRTPSDPKCRPDATLQKELSVKSSIGGQASSGASFCEEIRNRTHRMQQEMKKREDCIANLHVQMQNLQNKHRYSSEKGTAPVWPCLCAVTQAAWLVVMQTSTTIPVPLQ